MKLKVALYDSRDKALNAIELLEEKGFPMKSVSLIGKVEIVDDHLHVSSYKPLKNGTTVAIGAGAGTIVGLLTGMGVFAIPGFGMLYGAGALVGAIAGLDLGIVTGGLSTLLATIGIEKDQVVKYEEHITEGAFMVVIDGTESDAIHAEEILHTEGAHLKLV
jgi:uncharacterized membrane protein